MTPDATLLRQAQAGDVAAFEALVRRHFGLVYTIALARLRDREIAEDLAQEVMLRAFLHLKSLRADSTFPAWVARIARNLAIDWQRRGQRASRLLPQVPLDEAKLETLRAGGKGAREAMVTHQESEALREALFNLPEDQRELVLLHHSEGLSQSELAERLGTTQATISRRLRAAREALRDQLEPLIREALPALRPTQGAVAKSIAFIAGAAALSSTAKASLAASAPVGTLAEASVGAVGIAASLPALIAGGIKAMATWKSIAAAGGAIIAGVGGTALLSQDSPPASEFRITAINPDGETITWKFIPSSQENELAALSERIESGEITPDEAVTQIGLPQMRLPAEIRVHNPVGDPTQRLQFWQTDTEDFRLADSQGLDFERMPGADNVWRAVIEPEEMAGDLLSVNVTAPDNTPAGIHATHVVGATGESPHLLLTATADQLRVSSTDAQGAVTEWTFNSAERGAQIQQQFERGEISMEDVLAEIQAPEIRPPVSLRLENHPADPSGGVFLFQSDRDQSSDIVPVTWTGGLDGPDTWTGRIEGDIGREFLSVPATVNGVAGTFAARLDLAEQSQGSQ